MLQHCARSRNKHTATDEKKKTLLCFGCDFSGWYNFGKIIKTVATRCHILKQNALNSISAAAPPQTPQGKLTAFPQTLYIAGFKGLAILLREGGEGKGMELEGRGRHRLARPLA